MFFTKKKKIDALFRFHSQLTANSEPYYDNKVALLAVEMTLANQLGMRDWYDLIQEHEVEVEEKANAKKEQEKRGRWPKIEHRA